jgi:hypothetical protein
MLWKKLNPKESGNKQEARQADWLWRRVRHAQDSAVLERESNHPEIAQARELGELTDAVRYELEQSTQDERDAHDSFAIVHGRLMQAIEESQMPAQQGNATVASQALQQSKDSHDRHFFLQGIFRHGPVLQWLTTFALIAVVGIGAHQAGRAGAGRVLPVQSLVDQYDASLKSPAPFELIADNTQDPKTISKQWSRHLGMKVHVPAPKRTGVKLLGANRHLLWDRPVAQTHFLKDNVRVALYQVNEARCGLNGLDEVNVGGKVFLTGNHGAYRVVAWRADDNVMTMVSPLAMSESLKLAKAMRDSNDEQKYAELVDYRPVE